MASGAASSRPLWALATGLTVTLLFLFFNYSGQSRASWSPKSASPAQHNEFKPDTRLFDDIRNATLGFQKIFVINLPSRTDHRDSMALAAHFSGIQVEYVDGVTHVEEKSLPPHPEDLDLPDGAIGAWRAHMNIARTMIEQNITSALILEDDSDWDLRIKSQLQDFAKASKILLQPRANQSEDGYTFYDMTNPRKSEDDQIQNYGLDDGLVIEPTTSPYADIDLWDILWLGHCGTRLPRPEDRNIPLGRVIYADETVPEPQHVEIQFGNAELSEQYPEHSRAVHRVNGNVCTLGYAISLPGARRMLYELSVKKISSPMDISLGQMCEGADGRKMCNCLSIQPQLFQHHRPVGPKKSQSDIVAHDDEYNPTAFTKNIRWSTRVNFPKLIDGDSDWVDTFPDGAERADLGFR